IQSKCGLEKSHMTSSYVHHFWRNVTNQRYIFINQYTTWSQAQAYCRIHYTDLVLVRNQDENEEIRELVQGRRVWIGLFRDSWKWSDQGNSSFRYWKQTQPDNFYTNEFCAVATLTRTSNGTWKNKFPL
uniref:C-type lectin domain-containing protein n=1 Tax=Scleropages formosus TaxID=113540 RepID=A0A8C9S6H5_SCLFO